MIRSTSVKAWTCETNGLGDHDGEAPRSTLCRNCGPCGTDEKETKSPAFGGWPGWKHEHGRGSGDKSPIEHASPGTLQTTQVWKRFTWPWRVPPTVPRACPLARTPVTPCQAGPRVNELSRLVVSKRKGSVCSEIQASPHRDLVAASPAGRYAWETSHWLWPHFRCKPSQHWGRRAPGQVGSEQAHSPAANEGVKWADARVFQGDRRGGAHGRRGGPGVAGWEVTEASISRTSDCALPFLPFHPVVDILLCEGNVDQGAIHYYISRSQLHKKPPRQVCDIHHKPFAATAASAFGTHPIT